MSDVARGQHALNVISAVVNYGWPWQFWTKTGQLELGSTLRTLLYILHVGKNEVRLDPDHEWDWPIETRDGFPVWGRFNVHSPFSRWYCAGGDKVFRDHRDAWTGSRSELSILRPLTLTHLVAPHPLRPDEPPLEDWTPEGKRVMV